MATLRGQRVAPRELREGQRLSSVHFSRQAVFVRSQAANARGCGAEVVMTEDRGSARTTALETAVKKALKQPCGTRLYQAGIDILALMVIELEDGNVGK